MTIQTLGGVSILSGEVGVLSASDAWALSPITHWLYEWTDYVIKAENADQLKVGSQLLNPLYSGSSVFQVRFENSLGRAALQPYRQGRPNGPPVLVEVLSRKYPTPAQHIALLRTLTQDVANLGLTFPYTVDSSTAVLAGRGPSATSALFVLHFLLRHASALQAACAIIRSQPHHALTEQEELVGLASVREAGPRTMMDILQHPERWQRAAHVSVARNLAGYAPREVTQRRAFRTLDTPENRFVLAFLTQLAGAMERLQRQVWWRGVFRERQERVGRLGAQVRQTVAFLGREGVGPQHTLPQHSRVLMRREGYAPLRRLWEEFHRASSPLTERAEAAMDVRDVAQLYEVWGFYRLLELLQGSLGVRPVLQWRLSNTEGLGHHTEASFEGCGTLVYNGRPSSYALPLRPDYMWNPRRGPSVAMDAKFRFDSSSALAAAEGSSTFKADDLTKMHAYRDALSLRAAVIIYPGSTTRFYSTSGGVTTPTLMELLHHDVRGVGAFSMSPLTGAS